MSAIDACVACEGSGRDRRFASDLYKCPDCDGTGKDSYHRHLDTCSQCANNPFFLCPVGAKALEVTALKKLAL